MGAVLLISMVLIGRVYTIERTNQGFTVSLSKLSSMLKLIEQHTENANVANTLQKKLNAAGYAAELQETQVDGITYIRIRIEGFETKDDANSFASTISNQYGIQKPWVVKF